MSALSTEGLNGFPLPVGSIMMWCNDSSKPYLKANLEAGSGWLVCNGRQLEIAKYPELYKIFNNGNKYNANAPAVPDEGYFYIPNLPNPDYATTYKGLLLGGVQAGNLVSASAQVPIASAELTITPQMLPDFDLAYDNSSDATKTKLSGTYYQTDGNGNKYSTYVYSKSATLKRSTAGGNKFLRDDITYNSVGGLGTDDILPRWTYNAPNADPDSGLGDPVDITASINQGTFDPPNFEIVPIIRVLGSQVFN